MTTSLVRKQLPAPASEQVAPGVPAVETTPLALVSPITAPVAAPRRPPLHLVLAGLRRRALGTTRAESAESDAIVALVAEQAQSRADARYRNDEGGYDDDGGWG